MNDIIDKDQIKDAKDILKTQFSDFISKYIEDTQSIFAEIDINHATGQTNQIGDCLHKLKSSSYQVGAGLVFQHIKMMEDFIHNYHDDMADIPFQTRFDAQFQELRRLFADYREAIQAYL